ncbi:hypothetical protein SMA60_27440, partial [Escherichia coli]|uniref:hypothetical protein n=1 Tax=Escherichia coli TaxID=562 RepID=UPI00307A3D52
IWAASLIARGYDAKHQDYPQSSPKSHQKKDANLFRLIDSKTQVVVEPLYAVMGIYQIESLAHEGEKHSSPSQLLHNDSTIAKRY